MSEHNADSPAPDTAFVPQLDARQRAMLAEMGVRVWAPQPQRWRAPLRPPNAHRQSPRPPPRHVRRRHPRRALLSQRQR